MRGDKTVKKKLAAILICICCLLAFTLPTKADMPAGGSGDGGHSSEQEGQDTDAGDAFLTIDDKHIYEGMDRAYQSGYEPRVSDGRAVVVLPLVQEGDLSFSAVRAVPELGTMEDSPFVVKNYQKTVKLTKEKIKGSGKKKSVFLVRFDFLLQKGRKNGVYPVNVNISYNYQGSTMYQSFTVYVRITDGKNAGADQEAENPKEEKPFSEPKVIVSKVTGMPKRIESGSEISFTAVLKNTNKKKYIQNMTVTVSCEETGISLISDSSVFYFEKLGRDSTLKLPLKFQIDKKTAAGRYPVTFEMSYDNPDAAALSSTGKIELEVSQQMKVEMETGKMPEEVNAGDSISVPVQAMNMGRGSIYNVKCTLDAPGLTADNSLFLGNIDGGSAASGELTVFAGMVCPEAQTDQERYGATSGNLVLTYEDESGKEYQAEQNISVKINPLEVHASSAEEDADTPKVGRQMLFGSIILCAVLAAGVLIPLLIRRKTKRMEDE